MITLYRGDDTGGQLGKNVKIAFHCDDAVDMDGVTVRFNLLNVITKEWTNVHDGDILEMFVTHEQSGRLPLGFLFGKIWGEDSSGKVRTFANRLPIIVTHDLRKVYGSDGLDSQDIHVYSSVDWDAIANKPTLFPSKIELVEGLSEALDGMVKSVNGKTADAAGAVTLTLDSFANKDGEIQVKQTLMISRDGGQTFNAVATLVDVWNEIDNHNSSATAHANLMAAIASTFAKKSDIPSVVAPSASATDGQAADAKAVGEALKGKLDSGEAILEKDAYGLTDGSRVFGFFVRKNGGIFIGTAGGIVEIPYLRPGTMALDVDIADATKLTPVFSEWTLGDHSPGMLIRNISATYDEVKKGWETTEELSSDGGQTWNEYFVLADENPDPDKTATSITCVSATFVRTIIGYTTANGENLMSGTDDAKTALFAGADFSKACAYKIVTVGSDGMMTDRAINVTSASSVTVPDDYTDLLIRASVTGSLSVTVPDGVTKYGDAFPAETGEYIVTITKLTTGEAFVKTLKLEVANA